MLLKMPTLVCRSLAALFVLILLLMCRPLVVPPIHYGSQIVYPGAEGFGTNTKAGRGGAVIKVTNLNDSGPGSLRVALGAEYPRIVVFEVAGLVELKSDLIIKHPFVTVAGQTAPSPGITIKGAGLTVESHDVLIQHLRIRVGDLPEGPKPISRDAIQLLGSSSYNVVIDHISASWAIDENGSTWNKAHSITISNSIFSEGLDDASHPKGPHSTGFLVGDGSRNIFFSGNLFAHNADRNPRLKGETSVIILNNLMFNSRLSAFLTIGSSSGPNYVSVVGNTFIAGPQTPTNIRAIAILAISDMNTEVFILDNIFPESGTLVHFPSEYDPIVASPPIWIHPLKIRSARETEAWVLQNAGARPADRDEVDKRVVHEVKTRSGRIIDSQEQVGAWPKMVVRNRIFETPKDPNGDSDGDGFTNIEEVLYQMARRVEGYDIL